MTGRARANDRNASPLPPNLAVALKPLTTLTTDGTTTVVQIASAPADGAAAFTAKALVSSNGSPWRQGGYVQFNVQGSALFTANGESSFNADIGADGTATASFVDQHIESGTLTATVYIQSVQGPSDGTSYTFIDPWSGLSGVTAAFGGNRSHISIYANGLHQAPLTLALALSSANNTRLTSSNEPSLQDVTGSLRLIDYVSGVGLSADWNLAEPNDFSKGSADIAAGSWDEAVPQVLDEPAALEAVPSRLEAATTSITYYLSNSSRGQTNDLSLGLTVTPTGSVIVKSGEKADDGTWIGQLEPAPTISFFQNGQLQGTAARISTLMPLDYSRAGMLSIQGCLVSHSGQNDDGPTTTAADIDDPGNYWRQWDYIVSVSNDVSHRYGTGITQCRLGASQSLPADYAFAERSNILYNYKAYFWPINVCDAGGQALTSTSTFTMQSTGSRPVTIDCSGVNQSCLYFTLFCAFGNASVGSFSVYPINVDVFDNFGNSGKFRLNAEAVPQQYDSETLESWQPFVPRKDDAQVPDQSQPGSNGNATLVSGSYSGNVMLYTDKNGTYETLVLGQGAPYGVTFVPYGKLNDSKSYSFDGITWSVTNNCLKVGFSSFSSWLIKPIWRRSNVLVVSQGSGTLQILEAVIEIPDQNGKKQPVAVLLPRVEAYVYGDGTYEFQLQ
jgi:hypothetical protein